MMREMPSDFGSPHDGIFHHDIYTHTNTIHSFCIVVRSVGTTYHKRTHAHWIALYRKHNSLEVVNPLFYSRCIETTVIRDRVHYK